MPDEILQLEDYGSEISSDANDIGTAIEETVEESSDANDVGTALEEDSTEDLTPSLENYRKRTAGQALQSSKYSEDSDPALTKAMQGANPIDEKLRGLGKMNAQDRAKTGAAVGGLIGAKFMGPEEGAILGGSIGAFIGRGGGLAQSGEQAKLMRNDRIWNSLKTMGAVKENGQVDFDEDTVQMPSESSGRLKNLQINALNGSRDRSLYELDGTNPLTARAVTVAKPLGMYLSQAMLGYRNKKDPAEAEAPQAATAMFANTFSDGVDNETAVYSRARAMVKKMGLKEANVRSYFDSIKQEVPIQEAESIKKGLDILFVK